MLAEKASRREEMLARTQRLLFDKRTWRYIIRCRIQIYNDL